MTDEPVEMDPETIVRYGCIETLKQSNIENTYSFYTDDADYYRLTDEPSTVEEIIADGKNYQEAFEDLDVAIHETVVDRDQVSFRYTVRGTHTGELQNVPPTGESVEAQGIGFAELEDGLIDEYHLSFDSLDLFQQLGVV